ncbi:hypothetical protein EMIHUDRAFT_242522 [Emiliania huxleyi CCMP1516]|uniref:Uncharacterized protein n=2 Tax=Emiliania huxleyi TaxID=2903 RepID=A0A0D3J8K1_EMIH1|nr:hypothetical protein EMIHUDRAFT_242522 [Emiliania huxleyi CCMP1516]EOD19836.1 hypothetical protein EMIHUDRAFT_242522 [Emiliania huxleyi CCMP1516]|eukprot:XP_005772265.1 hypothetical protein EMIHUDRAFT_242522 [Emiliania huxleyi CCMP1516]
MQNIGQGRDDAARKSFCAATRGRATLTKTYSNIGYCTFDRPFSREGDELRRLVPRLRAPSPREIAAALGGGHGWAAENYAASLIEQEFAGDPHRDNNFDIQALVAPVSSGAGWRLGH